MPENAKKVSKVPPVTPELLEKNEDEQREWRKLFDYAHPTGQEYAARVIESNLAILDALERQLKDKTIARTDKTEIRVKMVHIKDDTAIWLASIGHFAPAAVLTSDKHQRKLYVSYAKAVALDDDAWCKHPLFSHVDGQLSQVAYREFDFYSETHLRRVSMVRCGTCGFRNAKDLVAELQKLSQHRAEVVKTGKDVPVTIAEIVK